MIKSKKVDVKYPYYNSVIAVTSMLVRFEYDPVALYIQNGRWDIRLSSQYADGVVYRQILSRVSGIGFFEDATDKCPSIVIDVEKQQIHILDERHVKTIKEKTGKSIIYLTVAFDQIFGDRATWEMLVNEISENLEV